MLQQIRALLEMIRFSHTLFAMPFAILSSIMAWSIPAPASNGESTGVASFTGGFHWQQLVGILLCMVFARSAAMAFNRLVDRRIDAGNPRTRNRHLVTGELSVGSVGVFTIVCSACFVVSTLVFLPNRWPMYLSVPVLLVLMLYSYTKRFTSLAHFWLGVSLMLAPVCAWIAIRGQWLVAYPLDLAPAMMLGCAVLLWVSGFDIIYACQDESFDRQAKLHSVPSRFGTRGALRIAAICHATMFVVLAAWPVYCPQLGLGPIYYVGVTAVAGLLIYEHQLVRPDDLGRVNTAFFSVNVVVSVGLLVIVSLDVLL